MREMDQRRYVLEKVRPAVPGRSGRNPFTGEPMTIAGRPRVVRRVTYTLEPDRWCCEQTVDDFKSRPRFHRFRAGDDPEFVLRPLLVARMRSGYALVGSSRPSVPRVLLEELFEEGAPGFLPAVFDCLDADMAGSFATRWIKDERPVMRAQLLAYVDDGCDRPGHRALVKRLFKLAESASDDQLIGHFVVAFDRLKRRVFRPPQFVLQGADDQVLWRGTDGAPFFSRRTRSYLQRRAFRYLRRLVHRDPARAGRAIRYLLRLYDDVHLDATERLLDAWSLVHLLYGSSVVLVRGASGVRLAPGRTVRDLDPAPLFPDVFAGTVDGLVDLVLAAQSRLVRRYVARILADDASGGLAKLPPSIVVRIAASPDFEVRQVATRALGSEGALALGVADFQPLFESPYADVVAAAGDAAVRALDRSRLSAEECRALVGIRDERFALQALSWVGEETGVDPASIDVLVGLVDAPAPAVRRAVLDLLAKRIGDTPSWQVARALCDARHAEPRALGLSFARTRLAAEPEIWLALAESPYADVRQAVLESAAVTTVPAEPFAALFATVLRSLVEGRGKATALRAAVQRLDRHPTEASRLVPFIGTLVRSLRGPERSLGLAGLARLAHRSPALRAVVANAFPEIRIALEVSA